MSATKENALVGPCGGSCGHCPFYLAKDDPAIMEYVVTEWGFNRDKLPCQGCRPLEGKSICAGCTRETLKDFHAEGSTRATYARQILTSLGIVEHAEGSTCATYACSVEHGVDFCYECPEFPCVKLQPSADMADILPHNLKVFHLCCLKRQGLAEWLKNYEATWSLYFLGKLVIGQGPQTTESGLRTIKEYQDHLQRIRDQLQQNVEKRRPEPVDKVSESVSGSLESAAFPGSCGSCLPLKVAFLACDVLRPELEYVLGQIRSEGLFDCEIAVTYLRAGLHVDFHSLKVAVLQALDQVTADKVILLYGSQCHPEFHEFLKDRDLITFPQSNCIELILGERMREINRRTQDFLPHPRLDDLYTRARGSDHDTGFGLF
jgi:hypothetical protein